MHAAIRLLLASAFCLGLSACFTSPDPLVGAADAVFPFERLVFREQSLPDDRQTMTREGDAYTYRTDESEERAALVRFREVGANLYVAQMEVTEGGKVERLYAFLRADLAARRVDSYAAVKPDDFVAQPGLSICDTSVCIEDLDAYVAYGKALIDSGRPPDVQYVIIEME
ncbi:MAG TPA: hypothetical protein VFK86_20670 [Bauldia sp.]|nr:hypothetical protein [Bauldia sp.]